MTKLINNLFSPESALFMLSAGFLIMGMVLDTVIMYPFCVASVLAYFSTKAICQAIRENKND